jgi:hypothetical protein
VEDGIDLRQVYPTEVSFMKGEALLSSQVGQVLASACDEVVDDNDLVAFLEQQVAHMGAEETGAAAD